MVPLLCLLESGSFCVGALLLSRGISSKEKGGSDGFCLLRRPSCLLGCVNHTFCMYFSDANLSSILLRASSGASPLRFLDFLFPVKMAQFIAWLAQLIAPLIRENTQGNNIWADALGNVGLLWGIQSGGLRGLFATFYAAAGVRGVCACN